MKHRPGLNSFLSTDLYGITADEYSRGRGNIETVKQMIEAGIRVIQYREKEKTALQMYEECLAIRQMTRESSVIFIVDDWVGLAMAVDADGVHLGQDDLPPQAVRPIIGDKMLIGLTTHSIEQAQEACKIPNILDYIGVGPIFPTKTKKDVCKPVGLEYLDYVAQNIDLPFVAIGGIKEHNIRQVRERGARMISLVTEIVNAPDIPLKVKEIRNTLSK